MARSAPLTRSPSVVAAALAALLFVSHGEAATPANGRRAAGDRAPAPVAAATPPVPAQRVVATVLDFVEQERGGTPFATRMLVTDGFLRIDDGDGTDGFLLYDREARTVYSVAAATRTVIAVRAGAAGEGVEPPLPLALDARRSEDADAPTVGGVRPVRYDFLANGRLCYSVAVVPGLLEEVRTAEREYLEVLAAEQRANVDKIPPTMLDPCDLSRHAFAPARHLEHGYPVQIWEPSGERRSLVGFDEGVAVDAALFVLPDGYERFDMDALR